MKPKYYRLAGKINKVDYMQSKTVQITSVIEELNNQQTKITNLICENALLEHKINKLKKEIEDISSCPSCGTTELLCGHRGVGCTHEN